MKDTHKFMQQLGKAMRKAKDDMVDNIVKDPQKAREMKKINKITMIWPDGKIDKFGK